MKIDRNITYLVAFFAGLLGTNQEVIISLTFLMLIDIITGVTKSGVIYGWRSVRSSILSAGLISKLTVLLLPLIIAYTAKGLGINLSAMVSGSIYVLVLSEAYSALGNIQAIRTRKEVKEFDVVSITIRETRKVFLKMMNKR